MDMYKALKDVMFDIECMVESKQIPNILNDIVYVRAREALAVQQKMHQAAFGVGLVMFFVGFICGAVVINSVCGGW